MSPEFQNIRRYGLVDWLEALRFSGLCGREKELKELVYPDLEGGIEGIKWVENCVKSADAGSIWVDFS